MEREDAQPERPSWNVCPESTSWVEREGPHGLVLDRLTWGFIGATTGLIANARIESVDQKRTFSRSFRDQRCLVPIDGWYEWKREGRARQPFYFARTTGEPTLLAGLFQGDRFLLITTETSGPLRDIHTRRPVAIDLSLAEKWVDPKAIWSVTDLQSGLLPETAFEIRPVSSEVNSTRNDGPKLIEHHEPTQSQGTLGL